MIYTATEIRAIIPALASMSDERVEHLLSLAKARILSVLRWKKLPDTIPDEIKVACVHCIEHTLRSEKTAGMTSFRQGNISVQYSDEASIKNMQENVLREILSPLIKVKVWS